MLFFHSQNIKLSFLWHLLNSSAATNLFKMLLKYRPEDTAAKKERLLKRAQAEAEGKTVEVKKPIVVKYGLNHVTYLIEQVWITYYTLRVFFPCRTSFSHFISVGLGILGSLQWKCSYHRYPIGLYAFSIAHLKFCKKKNENKDTWGSILVTQDSWCPYVTTFFFFF